MSMTSFFVAFLGVFFSGQGASILFGFSSSKYTFIELLIRPYSLSPGPEMTKATNAANYLFWLEQLEPSIRETPENREVGPSGYKHMDLDRLQFSYPMRPNTRVMRGVNLKVRKSAFHRR